MSSWQFSESSQPLLKQFMELVTKDPTNKWMKKFGRKTCFNKINEALDTNIVNEDIAVTNSPVEIIEKMEVDEIPNFLPVKVKLEKDDVCRKILDLEPVTHFDYIVEKCLENSDLYLILANDLMLTSVEKLCKHIYNTKNINEVFLENFYTVFLPQFLKRESSRLSMDLFVKAKCFPVHHKHLLMIILKDIELPSNVLHDFVSTLNTNEQTDFLSSLSHSNIPKEAFIYHLATIHTAYKNSQRNAEMQHYILSKLGEISENCASDRNYGRFLLNFLQSHRYYRSNIEEIETIVDKHNSPFKKSCLNVLKEIKMGLKEGNK